MVQYSTPSTRKCLCGEGTIECVNHALKNYREKLETTVKENQSYKGRLTRPAIRRLTAGARAAVKMAYYLLKDQCKGVLVKRLRPGQAM